MIAQSATLSHQGGRTVNQDCCRSLESESASCWSVADGLGGHAGAETASHLAVETVLAKFTEKTATDSAALKSYIVAAQAAILEKQQTESELASMHTTLAVLLSDGQLAVWAHIGDTRIYHLRDGQVTMRTKDHSLCQALVEAGELDADDIPFHRDRSRLLHSLGQPGPLPSSVRGEPYELQSGDAFLLCTDGFWEYISDTEMEVDFAKSAGPDAWLAAMWRRLLSKAEEGHDNYSATAVCFP